MLRRAASFSLSPMQHVSTNHVGGTVGTTALTFSRRKIHMLVEHTTGVPDKEGGVSIRSAGHVGFQTTPKERMKFPFLKEFYGHSPKPSTGRSSPSEWADVVGELPKSADESMSGKRFKLKARTTSAAPFDADPHWDSMPRNASGMVEHPGVKRTDIGELTLEQALKLHHFPSMAQKIYETSGLREVNCVHEFGRVYEHVFGSPLPKTPKHQTPQGIASEVHEDLRRRGASVVHDDSHRS